jgi:type II restriction enzyme
MNLNCDVALGSTYSSASQKARVISENWVAHNGYCLSCESERLNPTPRNTQARDFECNLCGHPYELKASLGAFGTQINDGAYASMMRRIESATAPSFLLLEYDSAWNVGNFFAIHNLLITPSAIKPRKALSATARRAGWIGCNILLSQIPQEGRIDIIRNGIPIAPEQSRAKFAQNNKLVKLAISDRTWAVTVLNLIETFKSKFFTLSEVYAFEPMLREHYPSNKHIREKLRQQLQVLRDLGYVKFVARGAYELVDTESD